MNDQELIGKTCYRMRRINDMDPEPCTITRIRRFKNPDGDTYAEAELGDGSRVALGKLYFESETA